MSIFYRFLFVQYVHRVNLEKTVNLDPLALLDLQGLEAYQECPVCPESRATVVSPVWTDPKENPARVVKREHKV